MVHVEYIHEASHVCRLGRKVDGGSNYKCSDFEDRERILERITMNITFEDAGVLKMRIISMISLGKLFSTHPPSPRENLNGCVEMYLF